MENKTNQARPERIAVTVAEAGELIGVKRTKAYSMIKAGELPVVRVGTITRVPLAALRERFSVGGGTEAA